MIYANTFLLGELLTCETVCHHMLLTHVQLIVLRLTLIDVGVFKMFIMTTDHRCDIAGTGNHSNSNK